MMVEPLITDPNALFVHLMRQNIGIREDGDNRGECIDVWNKFNGIPLGSPWCISVIQYFLAAVDYKLGLKNRLPKTCSALELWNKSPKEVRCGPKVGSIILWQMMSKTGLPTFAGHGGCVSQVIARDVVMSLEGNTRGSVGGVIDRDGKEFVEQRRVLDKNGKGMRYLGALDPWFKAQKA